ncbi:type A2 lantipeptide [Streptomyces tubercidicus]
MNSTPQVQTQEISDSDLDNVSGGLVGGVLGAADSIAPVSGTVGTATGLVDGIAGTDTAGVVGTATGLVSGL